jgi:hypothetical protein
MDLFTFRAGFGRRQCEPGEPYVPPDAKTLLAEAGVEVYETRMESLAVCEACSCPAYSALHYALVPKARLASARQAGFEPRDPPAPQP